MYVDKPGWLIVDYIGLFQSLQDALAVYSPSDREQAGVPIDELVNVMQEKYDIIKAILHAVSYDSLPAILAAQRLSQYARVLDYVLSVGDTLKTIARELVETIRRSATIDWTLKESVRARMRSRIKRLLAKYKYPPDKQEDAVKLIIEQAEHLAEANELDG